MQNIEEKCVSWTDIRISNPWGLVLAGRGGFKRRKGEMTKATMEELGVHGRIPDISLKKGSIWLYFCLRPLSSFEAKSTCHLLDAVNVNTRRFCL